MRRKSIAVFAALVVTAVGVASSASASPLLGTTGLNSKDSAGIQADSASQFSAISTDGRYVTYDSGATNLAPGDTNSYKDVFLFDTVTALTTRISVDSVGTQATGASEDPAISGDGRYITFTSRASNLVATDTNVADDVFLHDTVTAATTRISVDSVGTEGNGLSSGAKISADGRYITYSSRATNLVAGDTNAAGDVFLYDTTTAITTRVSVSSAAVEGNGYSYGQAISDDGHYITYNSAATNLVAGDTNAADDVFLYDRIAGTTTRVSVSSAAVQSNGDSAVPQISGNGRYISYESIATNLVAGDTNAFRDIFLYDTATAVTSRISVDSAGAQANLTSLAPQLSDDGRYITYFSDATTLVAGDTNGFRDVFLYDRTTAVTSRISVDDTGVQGNGTSVAPVISGDGRYVAYNSEASNLVAGDANGFRDIFRYQLPAAPAGPVVTKPALAVTGVSPAVPVTIGGLLVLMGLGVFALSLYRRRRAA